MAMSSQRESASTVQVDSRMERFKMYPMAGATPPAPREGNGEPPRQRLFVRIRCSVRMSTETHLVGGTTLRQGHGKDADARHPEEEAAARRFIVHDPAVLRSEPACHAAVRRMLTHLPQLAGYYGHRAADAQLWDRFVPPGLVARIVARVAREDGLVAAGGAARRSQMCHVWLRVHVTSVYSVPKALLLSCEDAAAGARAGSGALVGGGGAAQCAICMEEMVAGGVGVVALPGCSHAFHRGCILKWFHRAATCPSCRRDMMHHVPEMCRIWHMLN
ncbi:hypothetical protein D1007_23163 [Hordeum vulgare]|nr:hypothetical protein D1007_23163 [Hordeum vulgare]